MPDIQTTSPADQEREDQVVLNPAEMFGQELVDLMAAVASAGIGVWFENDVADDGTRLEPFLHLKFSVPQEADGAIAVLRDLAQSLGIIKGGVSPELREGLNDRIQKLVINPHDLVLVHSQYEINDEQILQNMEAAVSSVLPHKNKVLILQPGLSLSVISGGDTPVQEVRDFLGEQFQAAIDAAAALDADVCQQRQDAQQSS